MNAPIAQSVEQLPFKQTVAGSIPAGGTKICATNYVQTEKTNCLAFVSNRIQVFGSEGLV